MRFSRPSVRCALIWAAAVLLALGGIASTASAERPSASHLLPESTLAVVSVVNAPDLAQRFMNTAMGKMSQDPQLKPLVSHLYGSLSDAVAEVQDRIGLSLPELLSIPQGELTLALVAARDAPPAVVVLLDTGDQVSNARKLLEKGTTALEQSGHKKTEETIAGTKVITYENLGPGQPKAVYFEKDATLVAGTNPEVLKKLLTVWSGQKAATLADNEHYAAIMNRCKGREDESPQVLWFVDPVAIMRAFGEQSAQTRLAIAVLPALGLDGLSGLGGTLAFDAGQFDTISHAHLLLEGPRSGVLKMLALRSGDTKPERWVPADVATYVTLRWNVETTYRALATVYDSFRGEGALGQWMEMQFLGTTGINFEKELLPALEDRITMVSWIEQPVTVQSQAQMVALKLKDTELGNKAVEKLVAKFPDLFDKKLSGGKNYYQVKIPMPPGAPPDQPMPTPCFGVIDNYLMVANRTSLLEKAIATLTDGSKSLADELDFKLVASKIERQSRGSKPAMISFNRPEEGMRFLYDLVSAESTRQGLRRSAENSRFFKSIDTALTQNPLPPFAVLQRYLAPNGGMVIDDATGIHYTAFTLRR